MLVIYCNGYIMMVNESWALQSLFLHRVPSGLLVCGAQGALSDVFPQQNSCHPGSKCSYWFNICLVDRRRAEYGWILFNGWFFNNIHRIDLQPLVECLPIWLFVCSIHWVVRSCHRLREGHMLFDHIEAAPDCIHALTGFRPENHTEWYRTPVS